MGEGVPEGQFYYRFIVLKIFYQMRKPGGITVKVLVTGGAGYIGSHVVKALGKNGAKVLSVDNLSTGFEENILFGDLCKIDILDERQLVSVMKKFKPDIVIHLAAKIDVQESFKTPFSFYQNNFFGTLNLIKAMEETGVYKMIFSSSAAVYGEPEKIPIKEDSVPSPINPYGKTKLFSEELLRDFSFLNCISLRYFNVAGADPEKEIGDRKQTPANLIKTLFKVAKGELPFFEIWGEDYQTRDGTCVRDFVHVSDLAEAHIFSIDFLLKANRSEIFNCGYGRGFSVKEILTATKKISGKNFIVKSGPRREGDPPEIVADVQKIGKRLKWRPCYDDIEVIIKTSWEWEKAYS